MSQVDSSNPKSPDPPAYVGTYHTPGNHNTLELWLNPVGGLGGHFSLGGETLELRSIAGPTEGVYPTEGLYGILLDPQGDAVAVFRACLVPGGLTLELDIPGPQPDFSEAETLNLTRIQTQAH